MRRGTVFSQKSCGKLGETVENSVENVPDYVKKPALAAERDRVRSIDRRCGFLSRIAVCPDRHNHITAPRSAQEEVER